MSGHKNAKSDANETLKQCSQE